MDWLAVTTTIYLFSSLASGFQGKISNKMHGFTHRLELSAFLVITDNSYSDTAYKPIKMVAPKV